MNVSVVIPNWNGQDFLKESIDSLLKQTKECHIVVVENGSIDDSQKILDSYGKKITVLKQKHNLGFSGGVNVGIKNALKNSDYVALFNNDAVADKNWLSELTKTLDHNPEVGIVACKFLHMDDDKIDSTGDFYSIYGLPFPRGRGQKDSYQFDRETNVFGASGGSSIYRSQMLKQIGLFDEDFFAYFEDVDISFRAQLAGWEVHYNPKSVAYHHIGGTSGKINGFATYQTAKNFWFIYTKNMPIDLYFKYLPLAVYWYLRMYAARLIKGGFWPFTKGFIKGLSLLPKKLKQRHYIQANRQVTSKYISSILYHRKPPKINT